jgi:diguanylate cyclase (GGDEF)-like protein
MSLSPYVERDPETGLLTEAALERVLDGELSRAARHELPISVVLLEISGHLQHNGERESASTVARKVADVIESRIRKEDRAARLDRLKFAVIAVETADSAAIANDLAEHVRKSLLSNGNASSDDLTVAVGAVDCQFDELSRENLLEAAERALAKAMLEGHRVSLPSPPAFAQVQRPNGKRRH